MSSIASVDNATSPAAQAVAAGQAATNAGVSTAQAPSGLPPVGLAAASSANTVNAELVASQWGIDPASVSGVYGGAASTDAGLFSGDSLLPLLTNLTHSNAAQALELIGIKTPTPAAVSSGASGTPSATAAQAYSAQTQAALDQTASGGSGPANVDPLWGRTA